MLSFRRNKCFCRFTDFDDIFAEFVLEFVVHVSKLVAIVRQTIYSIPWNLHTYIHTHFSV